MVHVGRFDDIHVGQFADLHVGQCDEWVWDWNRSVAPKQKIVINHGDSKIQTHYLFHNLSFEDLD